LELEFTTDNIERRIAQHNSKTNRGWTVRYHDWKLVYQEEFKTRKEPIVREKEIKKRVGDFSFSKNNLLDFL